MKKTIDKSDIFTAEQFEKQREQLRLQIIELKKNRRIFVGPFAILHFENFDTLWWQIQEMLRIEKGGSEQIEDELAAYAPLVPQGQDLVATLMLEIDDPGTRDHILSQLGGIETMIKIKFSDQEVISFPTKDQERTTDDGRTSSVHFLHFQMNTDQVKKFKDADHPAIIDIFHPNYTYELEFPTEVHESLKNDLE